MATIGSVGAVAAFTASYLVAAVIGAKLSGNSEFVFYIIVMLVLASVVAIVHWRLGLTRALLWALAWWGLLHMAGGLMPVPKTWPYNGDQAVLYSLWLIPGRLKYDHIVHAYGFGVTTWLCWHSLYTLLRRPDGSPLVPTLGLLTLAAAAGVGFGALNEIVEFIAVLSLPNTNVGGYINTGWDLVSNLVGAVAACLLIRWRYAARPDHEAHRH